MTADVSNANRATAADDVSRTIEFSRDRERMSKVPWLLLLLLASISFAIYFDPRPSPRELLIAFLVVAALFVARLLADVVLEAMFAFDLVYLRQLAGAIVVLAAIAVVLAALIISARGGVKNPADFPGWIVSCLLSGWIGHTLYRHFKPERPQLALSPQGLAYRIPGAVDVLIPWREIKSVSSLAQAGFWQTGNADSGRGPTAFQVSRDFYDHHIYVRSLLRRGPNWDSVFTPVDGAIRIVLNHERFSVEAKAIRAPLEARWKAFRDRAAPTMPAVRVHAGPAKNGLVLGAWSWESTWDLVPFLIPLAGIAAVVADALLHH